MPDNSPGVDIRQYRDTMGLFATGVSVVAVGIPPEVSTMTVNTLTSVSLEPTLVLFCPHKDARIVPLLIEERRFNFSILSDAQYDLSSYFAGIWKEKAPLAKAPIDKAPPEYEFIEWAGGVRLAGCLAALACEQHAIYDGGDHLIIVGRVTALYRNPEMGAGPLLFYGGRYHRLDDELSD